MADPTLADRMTAVLDDAIARGLTPGAAAAVVTDVDDVCAVRGTLAPDDTPGGAHAVTADTVYDLASLTKLLVTATLVADAVDDGVIALDDTPWPSWPGVTVAHALAHSTGLPAHQSYFETLRTDPSRSHLVGRQQGRDLIVGFVNATAPEHAPGTVSVYSDLGFIALGDLLERRRGRRLDHLWQASAMADGTGARFVSLEDDGYHPLVPAVAPTEHCPWRRRIVQGQVHDDNAFAMGGIAGHAGLFGSLGDVCVMARRLLRRLADDDDTLARFAFTRAPIAPGRGLGFDIASPGGSTGDVLGPRAVGHLGFTGTSLWLDPDAGPGGTAWVLLANTVHFGRDGVLGRNKTLRVGFHRATAPA